MTIRRLATLTLTALSPFLCSTTPLRGQTPAARFVDSARTEIDAASAGRDDKRLADAVVLLDRALVAFPAPPSLLHYRGSAAYRQAVSLFVTGNRAAASPYVERAIADLDASREKLAWPETYALAAALIGFQIA